MNAASARVIIRASAGNRRRGRKTELVRSIGGLSSMLDDALRARGGVWLAWSGNVVARGNRPTIRSLAAPGGEYRRYLCHGFSRRELAVFYRAADALLVTPLRDGMNLVAQEFVATRPDEDGVLILSRFAGAAERLREALIVNPYDVSGLCRAIECALAMKPTERRTAMRAMRRRVLSEDMQWWLGWFLAAAATVDGGRGRAAKKRTRRAGPTARRARPTRR